MKKLLIATRNPGKFGEIKNFLADLPVEVVSLSDLKIQEDIEESGKTYEENAKRKAEFYSKLSGLPTIADDSGIEIEALGRKPGKNTRRWLGYEMTDEEIISHLYKISKELGRNRRAHFISTVCLALPNGQFFLETGDTQGIIAEKPSTKRTKGYPFRSFFYLEPIKKFFFEDNLTDEEQKLYNHRYKAISKLKPIIKKVLSI